jgi:hypothetical protein
VLARLFKALRAFLADVQLLSPCGYKNSEGACVAYGRLLKPTCLCAPSNNRISTIALTGNRGVRGNKQYRRNDCIVNSPRKTLKGALRSAEALAAGRQQGQ